jgi:hypothetical protein
MTDRDRAFAPNKHEAQEATYIALDRLRRLMNSLKNRRSWMRRKQQ